MGFGSRVFGPRELRVYVGACVCVCVRARFEALLTALGFKGLLSRKLQVIHNPTPLSHHIAKPWLTKPFNSESPEEVTSRWKLFRRVMRGARISLTQGRFIARVKIAVVAGASKCCGNSSSGMW